MDHLAPILRTRGRRSGRRSGRGVAVAAMTVAALAFAACTNPGSGSTSAPTAAAASGAAIPADLPLLGSWQTEVTKADLAAAGISEPGLQNENSGRFTWTFAPDGTWTSAQESLDGSPINTPVFRGTYTVDGQVLVATTEFPEQYRDDGLRYAWSIEDGSVTFDVLNPPDDMLEAIVESHPWTRAG